MRTNLVLVIFTVGFLIIIGVIIAMFVSLAQQGDERREMIIEKASTKTFAATVLYVAFNVVNNMYKVLSGADLSPKGMNPFVTLTTIAVIYAIELIYHKKKYGD